MTRPTTGETRGGSDDLLRSLTTTEAARHLRLSVSTVQSMVERGDLSAWRTGGGHRRISLESVKNWASGRSARGAAVSTDPQALATWCEPRCVRILIAGPQQETTDCMTRLTAALSDGVDCERAEDAFDALLLAGRERPDLLICCAGLMPIDGVALVRRLRAHVSFRNLPAVILSRPGERPSLLGPALRPGGILIWDSPLPIERIRGLVEAQQIRRKAPG